MTGTWKMKIAIRSRAKKLIIATATYGSCLPMRNSNRVIGVERKLAIEPVSFSRTTAIADMIAGIRHSISMKMLGTIALTLRKA